jgi:hypothetical protein
MFIVTFKIDHYQNITFKGNISWSGMVAHTCNPSTPEAEARGSWIWGQPKVYSKTLSPKSGNKSSTYRYTQ